MTRKGLGRGLGKGYKNIVPRDPYIHGLSAKGVKTYNVTFNLGERTYGVKNADTGKEAVYHAQEQLKEDADYNVLEFIQDTNIEQDLDAKGKKVPKIKDVMTEDEVKRRYQYELDEGLINTEEEGVPYYDDFNEFKRMMQDMNIKIVDDDGTSGQDRESYTDTQDRESYTVDAKGWKRVYHKNNMVMYRKSDDDFFPQVNVFVTDLDKNSYVVHYVTRKTIRVLAKDVPYRKAISVAKTFMEK